MLRGLKNGELTLRGVTNSKGDWLKVRPAIPVRVLAPKPKRTFKYPGPLARCILLDPCILSLWREVLIWVLLNSSSGIVCWISMCSEGLIWDINFENLSCRCPPRSNPSIPDHKIWQGLPWEHTEGIPTLRWWPRSVFPGFPEMHHFCPANRPTH